MGSVHSRGLLLDTHKAVIAMLEAATGESATGVAAVGEDTGIAGSPDSASIPSIYLLLKEFFF